MTSPIPLLLIQSLTFVFMILIFGNVLAEESFVPIQPANFASCGFDAPSLGSQIITVGLADVAAATGYIGCILNQAWRLVVNVALIIYGVFAFIFNLVSFNIPGSPWYVRVPTTLYFGGSAIWTIATLARGTKA